MLNLNSQYLSLNLAMDVIMIPPKPNFVGRSPRECAELLKGYYRKIKYVCRAWSKQIAAWNDTLVKDYKDINWRLGVLHPLVAQLRHLHR